MGRKNKKYLKKTIDKWYEKAVAKETEIEGYDGIKYTRWNIEDLRKNLLVSEEDIGKQVWVAENTKTTYTVVRDIKESNDGTLYFVVQEKGIKMRRQRSQDELIIHPDVFYEMENQQ